MSQFKIKFLGVCGSTSYSRNDRALFGTNTSCILITCGETNIILDMGTGAAGLLDVQNAHIFLGHFHYDHIEGIPYFEPFFAKGNTFNIYASHKEKQTKEIIDEFLKQPFSPLDTSMFSADMNYISIPLNKSVTIGDDILVETIQLNHPGGCTGYKITYKGKSVANITDHEIDGSDYLNIQEFCKDVDVLIHDAFLTQKEYDTGRFYGWGHSTYEQVLCFSDDANIKKIICTHHKNSKSDEELLAIENELKLVNSNISLAKEGMEVAV